MAESDKRLNRMVQEYLDSSVTAEEREVYVENFSGRRFTNREFVSLVSDIQHKLRSLGVGKNDVVVIKLGRCVEHMASRLAVIALGAVCLPLEADIPDGRFDEIKSNLEIKAVIDGGFFPLTKCDGNVLVEDIDDNEPCFIIFTSGSTGKPKGILHSRKTLTHLRNYTDNLHVEWPETMSVAVITNVSFIISWTDFVFQLYRKAVIHLFDNNTRRDLDKFRGEINRIGIQCLISNPNYYRMLGPNTSAKIVILGGERAGTFEEEGRTILDCYGSSEVICASRVINKDDSLKALVPVPEGQLYTVDENGNVADEGELVYHGPGIMLGYLDDNPGKEPIETYHTKDMAKKVGNGYVIVGRKDSMIKINGQRVEPAETESVMCQIPGVLNATVKPFDDCGNYMCAYYISKNVDEDSVREYLSARLNAYQVPRYIRRFDTLPLNNNGKIDRKALDSLRDVEGCTEAPSTELERIICEAFGNALGMKRIGIDDDFIRFGGDSMSVMKMIASFDSLKGDMKVALRPSDIIHFRSPRNLVRNIRTSIEFDCRYDLITGGPAPDSINEGYVIMKNFGERYFSLPVLISMDSWKDCSDAKKTITDIIGMFPVFSMRLEHRNGKLWMMFDREPEMIISDDDPHSIDVENVSGFDPDKDVSSRFIICKHGDEVSVLACLSHLIFDGRSAKPLIESVLKGRSAPDTGILCQGAYDEYVHGTEEYEKSKSMMERYVLPVFGEKIREFPKYDIESCGKLTAPMDVSPDRARRFARKCGISMTVLMAAAFGIAKANTLKSKETMFSLVTGGRSAPGTENSIGMFAKIVPVHISKKEMNTVDYLRLCAKEITDIVAHDEYPVSEMLPRVYPDFGILFQYSDFMETPEIPGVKAELLKGGRWHNNTTVSVVPNGETFVILLKYSLKYKEDDITELLCAFDETLDKLMTLKNSGELFAQK